MKQQNQFKDKFKFLTTAAGKVDNIRTQITQLLNRSLPARILSKANIFNLSIDISQDISTLMMFYTEDSLIESNILVAQKESSARGLSQLAGHNATRAISSRGILKIRFKPELRLTTPKLIFSNTTAFCSTNNLRYTANINSGLRNVSSSSEYALIEFIEGEYKTQKFVADGSPLYVIRLDDTNAIENYEIKVYVNNELWSKYDNLYAMGKNTKGFILRNGIDNQVDIWFGDDVHGKKLDEAATVVVEYLITNGETGNVEDNAKFKLTGGVYDAAGNEIELSEYAEISVDSGFSLGSNGENIETTRLLTGYNSRSLVFVRPENLKAYLSRLSILSHVDVWTLEDDKIFNMLMLPNLQTKLNRYQDYFFLPDDELTLNTKQKQEVKTMINASRRQATSTELVMHDPLLKKYAVFVYINASVLDKDQLRNDINDAVAKHMLDSTFSDVDMSAQTIISKSGLVDSIFHIDEVNQVSVDIISEENEIARINGYYDVYDTEYVGSVKRRVKRRVDIVNDENPNLGFSELGDLIVSERKDIPIVRSGFTRFSKDGNHFQVDKPVYIFYKNGDIYEEL